MLIDQFGYLYNMTTQADQRPGRDAFVRYRKLRADLDALLADWAELQRLAPQSGGR